MTDTSESTRRRLLTLLEDDRPRPEGLLAGLRDVRARSRTPAFSHALQLLIHRDVDERRAERYWEELLAHRRTLAADLGRDPGLRVAAADFFANRVGILENPVVLDRADWERVERSATLDDLTGLLRRGPFRVALERELRRCRRHGLPLALLKLDLDSFASVNDLYGHAAGDRVLERAGGTLRGAVRESDLCGRIGGERFGVLLPETERLGAFVVAERVRERMKQHFLEHGIDGRIVAMTVSGGIACHPGDGADVDALFAAGDAALSRAKQTGRDRIALCARERRSAIRVPFRPGSRVRLKPLPDGPAFEVEPLDLSAGGARVGVSPDALPPAAAPREAVRVTLETDATPADAATSHAVPARVLRLEPSGAAGEAQLALRFDAPLAPEVLERHALYPSIVRPRDDGR